MNTPVYITNEESEGLLRWFAEVPIFFTLSVIAAILAFCFFGGTFASGTADLWVFDKGNTILENILYLASNTNIVLFITSSLILGLLFILSVWSIFKFNHIEKRIIRIQGIVEKLENSK